MTMLLSDVHILIVEDKADNYNLMLRLLTSMGIEHCTWLSSGWKAAEEAEKHERTDLILLDINLPYEDGFEVHRKLREHPNLQDTLIVAVTANADEKHMQKAINEGFDGFIGKPISPDHFPEQVQRAIDGEPVWEYQ